LFYRCLDEKKKGEKKGGFFYRTERGGRKKGVDTIGSVKRRDVVRYSRLVKRGNLLENEAEIGGARKRMRRKREEKRRVPKKVAVVPSGRGTPPPNKARDGGWGKQRRRFKRIRRARPMEKRDCLSGRNKRAQVYKKKKGLIPIQSENEKD